MRTIPNDRGDGIDTVYYRRSIQEQQQDPERSLSLWQKFLAYKLDTSVYALLALTVGSIVFVCVYLSPLQRLHRLRAGAGPGHRHLPAGLHLLYAL